MIMWCAYCQHFQYEFEPFDQYGISHGVCQTCQPKAMAFSPQKNLDEIKAFYRSLREIALSSAPADVIKIEEESNRLGIRSIDLMMGVLQPLLAEIGDLWASGKVTVATEHRFSALVQDLIAHFRSHSGWSLRPPSPRLILVNAEDNFHTMGLQMAEAYFAVRGIPTLTAVPGLPIQEILDLLDLHKPAAIGFSVAMPTQMRQMREVVERMKGLARPPRRVLVGGPAVRLGLSPDPSFGIDVCRQLAEVPPLLGSSSPETLP